MRRLVYSTDECFVQTRRPPIATHCTSTRSFRSHGPTTYTLTPTTQHPTLAIPQLNTRYARTHRSTHDTHTHTQINTRYAHTHTLTHDTHAHTDQHTRRTHTPLTTHYTPLNTTVHTIRTQTKHIPIYAARQATRLNSSTRTHARSEATS